MSSTNSPIKAGKLVGHYPLVHFSSKLQLPFANILLVSARNVRRRPKKCESTKAVATPIHQKAVESVRAEIDSLGENSQLRKLSKLRISILNERKKKKIESFNSSLCSIYDQNIAKSKSETLKKDFEFAFKKMIGKKQISSKEKQLKASQELWNSMKLKKQQQIGGLIIGEHTNQRGSYSHVLHNKNSSQKILLNKTTNSFYNENTSFPPKLSKFYLTGHTFNKPKAPFVRFKDREMPDQYLRNCIPVKPEGEIKPWNHQSRRYKTEVNDGKSGEITEWLKASRHC